MSRVRGPITSAAKTALLRCGAYAALRRLKPSRNAAILRYHAVCGADGARYADPGISVTPEAFERHAAYLAAHYEVLPLPDIVGTLRAGKTLPANAVAITFDDGYADNLDAARVLDRFGLTATFYLTAGCLGGEQPFWPSEIRALLSLASAPSWRVTAATRPLTLPLATPEERQLAVRTLSRVFKANPIQVREDVLRQLRELAGNPTIPSAMLSWESVAELHRLGMTIGSHTLTHPNLPSAGPADARREIAGSKARLEDRVGAPVTMFSYPNGGADRYVTAEILCEVREAGYEAATTSANGFATAASDLFALERVQVAERLEDLVFALEVERFAFAPRPRIVRSHPASGG